MFATPELLAIDESAYLRRQVLDGELRPTRKVMGMALLDIADGDCQMLSGYCAVRYDKLAGWWNDSEYHHHHMTK